MSIHRIDGRITGYAIAQPGIKAVVADTPPPDPRTHLNETLARPTALCGKTYKMRVPTSEHAYYVTINDIVMDAGTPFEVRRPFEMFVNSKNIEQFSWVVALTRVVSSVFRKGGDVTFLVDELRAVFDPTGGYFKPGHGFVPSAVAEIGMILGDHLTELGLIAVPAAAGTPSGSTVASVSHTSGAAKDSAGDAVFPASARWCSRCNNRSLVTLDGCATCLSCGHSKCG